MRLLLFLCLTSTLEAKFKLGLEAFPTKLIAQLANKQVGLITNHTGINQQYKRNIELLQKQGITIATLYAPEHGLSGLQAAGSDIENSYDAESGLPIISLHKNESFCAPDLSHIDALIFDMQDCGIRHYTYSSIMYHMMETAAVHNKPFIVLDRPNPLGTIMEGPLVESDLLHFVAIAPLPLRHALTIGELALYFNKHCLKTPVDLTIVPLQNYTRDQGLNRALLVPLSPNIATLESCFGYCFGCILDNMRPFDVALDTGEAFQWILLPEQIVKEKKIDFRELIEICTRHNIIVLKQDRKETTPYTNEPVVGIKFKIESIETVSCSNFLWALIAWIQKYNINFTYRPLINHIVGTKQFTQMIEKKVSLKTLAIKVNQNLETFNTLIQDSLLYKPVPKVLPIAL